MLLREGVRDWDGFQAMVSRMALASASEMWRSSGPGGLACAARGVGRGAGGVVGEGVAICKPNEPGLQDRAEIAS